MRLTVLGAALLLSSTLASAQDRVPVERRVDTLEKQMRSVQRRVFAPGSPEAAAAEVPAPAPANTGAVTDLTARVDALERQLTAMTGLVEENSNRIRTLEERVAQVARDSARAEVQSAPQAVQTPAPQASAPQSSAATQADSAIPLPTPSPGALEIEPPSTDPAENAYLAGYRLWEAKRYDEAEGVLKEVVAKYPKHRRASWARNLLGRTYLDTGKPATAAEAFLSNYQDLPSGDRAPDSLYFLGAALMKLNKPQQACKVYDELSDVYAGTMRDFLKTSLPAARKTAKCTS